MTPRELVGERYHDALGVEVIVPAETREHSSQRSRPKADGHRRRRRACCATAIRSRSTSRSPPNIGTRRPLDGDRRTRHRQSRHDRAARHAGRARSSSATPPRTTRATSRCRSPSHRATIASRSTCGRTATRASIVVVAPARAYLPAGDMSVGHRRSTLHAALAAQLGHRRLHRSRTHVRDRGRRRRLARGHQPAARRSSQRSRSGEPVRADVAPVPQLAGDRRRRRARSARSRRAAVHRVDRRRSARRARQALRRLQPRRDAQGAGAQALLCRLERRARRRRSRAFCAAGGDGAQALRACTKRSWRATAATTRPGPTICAPTNPRPSRVRAKPNRARSSSRCICNGSPTSSSRASRERAKRHGVALYRDLAVGVESGGAEAWGTDDYVTTASVGAPPDLLNTHGSRLGLAAALARDARARRATPRSPRCSPTTCATPARCASITRCR